MGNLTRAIEIAAFAHHGQVDKGGAPYILHPLRVMLAMRTDEERIVAVLHDALEDGPSNVPEMIGKAWFSADVQDALIALCHNDGETYDEYIRRVMENPLAKRVKAADMRDNMDLSRIPNPTKKDYDRLAKYAGYIDALEA